MECHGTRREISATEVAIASDYGILAREIKFHSPTGCIIVRELMEEHTYTRTLPYPFSISLYLFLRVDDSSTDYSSGPERSRTLATHIFNLAAETIRILLPDPLAAHGPEISRDLPLYFCAGRPSIIGVFRIAIRCTLRRNVSQSRYPEEPGRPAIVNSRSTERAERSGVVGGCRFAMGFRRKDVDRDR